MQREDFESRSGDVVNEAFGQELRRTRRAAGMSLSALAAQVSYSKSHLSRIESGIKTPSVPLARRCDSVLGAGGRLAALVPHGSDPPLPGGNPVADPADDGPPEPRRRELLTATVGLSALVDGEPIVSRLAPDATLAAFERMLGEFRALGQSHSPVMLTTLMGTHIAMLHELALATSGGQRVAWFRLVARFCDYVGWMRQEAGRDDEALQWIQRAHAFAVAAEDEPLAAYSRIRKGEIALYQGDPLTTVQLAKRAQTTTTNARVRGLGALTEAQGHALQGDVRRCHEAIDRAAAWFLASAEGGEPELGVGSSTMPDPIAFVTAWCLNDLGRPDTAASILEPELLRLPEHAYRTRARYGARLALAFAGAGDISRMCEVLSAVLGTAADIDSATVRADLRRVTQEAKRWRSVPAVEEIIRRLALALQPRDRRLWTR